MHSGFQSNKDLCYLKFDFLLNSNKKEFLNKIHSFHINLNDKDIDKIVENTNFNNLKKLEDKNGFDEATIHSNFFRSGTSNQWKDVLTNTQINLIEKNLKSMMRYFNYI